jgi:hypothetical protein
MGDDMSAADHAFMAFLAACGDRFEGDELRMFRFFQSHPSQSDYSAVEADIKAYRKRKKKS